MTEVLWRTKTEPHQRTDIHYTYGTKRSLKVVPVRKKDNAWIFTDEHRAQAWAVVCFQRGHPAKTVLRKPTKVEAEQMLQTTQRAMEGPVGYKLGRRMGKRS